MATSQVVLTDDMGEHPDTLFFPNIVHCIAVVFAPSVGSIEGWHASGSDICTLLHPNEPDYKDDLVWAGQKLKDFMMPREGTFYAYGFDASDKVRDLFKPAHVVKVPRDKKYLHVTYSRVNGVSFEQTDTKYPFL